MNKNQLTRIVIKELRLCEQYFENEKLFSEKAIDEISNGINAAVNDFAGEDEKLEETASNAVYDDIFNNLENDTALFAMLSTYAEKRAHEYIDAHKEDIIKAKEELSEPIDSEITMPPKQATSGE